MVLARLQAAVGRVQAVVLALPTEVLLPGYLPVCRLQPMQVVQVVQMMAHQVLGHESTVAAVGPTVAWLLLLPCPLCLHPRLWLREREGNRGELMERAAAAAEMAGAAARVWAGARLGERQGVSLMGPLPPLCPPW